MSQTFHAGFHTQICWDPRSPRNHTWYFLKNKTMRFWFQTVFSEGRIWSSADFRGIDSNSLLGITLNYVGSLGIIWGNLGKEIWAGPNFWGRILMGPHMPCSQHQLSLIRAVSPSSLFVSVWYLLTLEI